MTAKEALKGIKQRINYSLHKPENVDTKERQQRRIDKSEKQISIIEQTLTDYERLKIFKQTFDNYELSKKQDFIAYENWQECEKELEELKRYPTSDEVCKALSEYFEEKIIYDNGSFINARRTAEVCAIGNLGLFYTVEPLPPHLVTMIGKFYEGLEASK